MKEKLKIVGKGIIGTVIFIVPGLLTGVLSAGLMKKLIGNYRGY